MEISKFKETSLNNHQWYCEKVLKIQTFTYLLEGQNVTVEKLQGADNQPDSFRSTAPFKLNPIQLEFDALRQEEIQKKGYVRMVILKAAQEGLSTVISSYGFKQIHLINNTVATTIAHEKASTARIFEMVKRYYFNLPNNIDGEGFTIDGEPATIIQEPRYMNPRNMTLGAVGSGWESFMEVFTAGKENTARSGNYSFCHSSEVAFHKDGEARGAIVRAIPDVRGTEIYDESTGNGPDGFFYHHFWDAWRGLNDYKAVFFPWFKFPKYSVTIPNKQVMEELVDTVMSHKLVKEYGDEEIMMKLYDLTWEQIYWRRNYIRNKCQHRILKPLDYFMQEMPATPDEAFVTTGGSVFHVPTSRLRQSQCVDPIFVGGIRFKDEDKKEVSVYEDPNGYLKIWKFPDSQPYMNRYGAGCDTMQGGGETGDPHSLYIADRKPRPWEIVAAWHGYTQTTGAFSKILKMLAILYGMDILYNIERMGWGVSIINELYDDEKYKKIMFDREEFKKTKKLDKQMLGWLTSPTSKPILIGKLRNAISSDAFVCPDKDFWAETITFVHGERYRNRTYTQMGAITKGKGAGRTFDDRVMSCGILNYTIELMNLYYPLREAEIPEPEYLKQYRKRQGKTTWMSA